MILRSLAVLLFSWSAQANVLFEPYAGYSIANTKFTTTAAYPDATMQNQSFTGSADGFSYGGKLAWGFSQLYIGGEYQSVRASKKLSNSSTGVDWTNTSIFGIVGYQMLNGLRIFGGMTVTPHKSVEAGTPDPTIYKGNAWKAGVGYRYRVPLAVNVDYIKYDLNKYEVGALQGDMKTRYKKFDYSAFLISISFPFEFGL